MHQEIDLAPDLLDLGESCIDAGLVTDVTVTGHDGADLGGQRFDPALQGLALIGQCDFATVRMNGLGDPPGD